jgi:hypothetical protein
MNFKGKSMKRYIFILLLALAAFPLYSAPYEDSLFQKYSSFEGRHFFIGFMQNEIEIDYYTGLELQIYVAARDTANLQIIVPGITKVVQIKLLPDSIIRIDIPEHVEVRVSEQAVSSLVEIISDNPVTVYAFNSQRVTSDSYAIIPVSHWGNEYITVNYPNDQYDIPQEVSGADSAYFLAPRSNEFMIMAALDSTVVDFTPKAITMGGKQIGRNYQVILDKGECYLVKSLNSQRGTNDLTGTVVRSNKPIGVLSGHVRTAVPLFLRNPFDSKNHLAEMLFPTEAWGRNFITAPFRINQEGDLFRIVALKDNTIVTYSTLNDYKTINLARQGDFAEISGVWDAAEWQSNNPIQLAQYMMHTGSGYDIASYDPCMVIVPPTEQFVSKILFQTPGNSPYNPQQFYNHWVTIIAEYNALSSLKLDKKLVKSFTTILVQNVIGTNYHWCNINLGYGKHELVADSGRFAGVLFGNGRADAYAMVLGASLTNPFKKDEIPPKHNYTEACGIIDGEIVEFKDENSTGIDFVAVITDSTYNYKWTIDKVTDTSTVIKFHAEPINLFEKGRYVLEYRDRNGNGRRFRLEFRPLSFQIPKSISFKDVLWDGEQCKSIKIVNTSNDTTLRIKAIFSGDPRITITTIPVLPATIPANSELICNVCFKPNGDAKPLKDSLQVNIDCERFMKIMLDGNVLAPSLETSDIDYGEVKLGETKCDTVYIINKGNLAVVITRLDLEQMYGIFVPDTNGRLPYNIKPGDTLKIYTCFTPEDTIEYRTNASLQNSRNIANNISLRGVGITPVVDSITVDWGRRRLGTVNDSTVYFYNRGSADALLTFKEFTSSSHTSDYVNIATLTDLSVDVKKRNSAELKFQFLPSDTLPYHRRSLVSVNSKVHDDVSISLFGQGTIPQIRTFDVDIDTIVIFTDFDTTADVVESYGNERLSIDSIYYLSGDKASFNVDYSTLSGIKLQVGKFFRLPLRFSPTRIGKHTLVLGVMNDALPSYQRKVDTIVITAYAKPADTTKYELSSFGPDSILVCNSGVYTVVLENKGNTLLNIQNIELVPTNIEATIITPYNLPHKLKADSSIILDIEVYSESGEDGSFTINYQINDTLSPSIETPVHFRFDKITVNKPPLIYGFPGDTVTVYISGQVPNAIETDTKVHGKIGIYNESFYLLRSDIGMNFSNSDTSFTSELIVVQKSDDLEFETVNSIRIGEVINWNLTMQFLALMTSKKNAECGLKIWTDKCYQPGENITQAEVGEVCVSNIRLVKRITGQTFLSISPNPASDMVKAEVHAANDMICSIVIYDALGKIYMNYENLNLKKGIHSFIFEIGAITNGMYIMALKTNNEQINKMFIITK